MPFLSLVCEKFGFAAEIFSPHGIVVTIPHSADLAVRYLLAKGRPYEDAEAKLIEQNVRPGLNVIELGGCMGIVSATIRKVIGPDARHVVVEAMPSLIEICGSNAKIGANPGTTDVVQAAVDYSGAAIVQFDAGHNAHMGHVSRAGEPGIAVSAITLSDLATRMPPDMFTLVCDIEGGELSMFAAEAGTLARVDLINLETHPDIYPSKATDLAFLLSRIGQLGFTEVAQIENVFCFRISDVL